MNIAATKLYCSILKEFNIILFAEKFYNFNASSSEDNSYFIPGCS
jgi:hypothetical protein